MRHLEPTELLFFVYSVIINLIYVKVYSSCVEQHSACVDDNNNYLMLIISMGSFNAYMRMNLNEF